MEVIRGWSHQPFVMTDASCVGEARRFCARAVHGWGWSEEDVGRLAIVATELGTNLVRHAAHGQLWIAVQPAWQEVELIALDKGPGMADVQWSSQDGVSTGSGSPGTGLGAIRRMANGFDIHSTPEGTVCLVRVSGTGRTVPARRWGAASIAAPGETVCGDAWAVAVDENQLAAMVVDGLGHGPHAALAAQAALDTFAAAPFAPLGQVLDEAHTRLQTTRGAAVFALRMDDDGAAQMHYAGAGNVTGRIVSGVFDRSMVTQHGTVGVQVRKPEITSLDLPRHALALVHSDGIMSRWKPDDIVPLLRCDATLIAAALLWRQARGRDDATVLVVKQGGALA